ncbi:MAG: trypsin-like peptidase domain-containing protein, partial [Candidatus Sungbacteria bacterium]|nr:trypsin-like peptidase domain-containing protein [Candidatus Sungbacteria bacterium]
FITEDGEILTNYHVIDGHQEIYGVLADGTTLPLDVVGYDKNLDVALLKVRSGKKMKFPYVTLGNSDAAAEADPIMIIGHPFNLRWTLSLGLVSNAKRSIPFPVPMIQVQSSINPGNSGSPVFAHNNSVIGIAQRIIESDVGFVIPINAVKSKLPAMRQGSQARKSDTDRKSPLTLEVVVDPGLIGKDGIVTKEQIVLYVSRMVSQSSSIFLTQVGRPLSVSKITFPESLPHFISSKEQHLKTAAALTWLHAVRQTTDRIVLLTDKVIIDPTGMVRGGYADDSFILMAHYSDQNIGKRVLLHELGHTCGAGHLLNPAMVPENNRLMAPDLGNGFMYDSKNLEIINKNCG